MLGMKRATLSLLRAYLKTFPCVALLGVRQCGKTTLLESLPAKWRRFDLERRADYAVISRDPDTFFRVNSRQVAIDEAQVLPEIFSALRVAIDARRGEKGRFVITGSSSPALLRSVSESLAGRVGIIEMAPFSWVEVTQTTGRDSFLRRLQDRSAAPADLIEGLKPRGNLARAHDFWFRGGYPEPWLNPEDLFRARWVGQYIQTYLFRDVKRLFPGLDDVRFRRFLEMLGGLSGRVLNYADIARALAVSQPTVRDWFDIAHGTFIWRAIPAYSKNVVKRVVKHPRGYLRDSGLLHALLHIPDTNALLSHPQMGASWEGMVAEEILRQLSSLGVAHQYSYYRTGAGAEVDLVVEGDFGRVAVEIKHTSAVGGRDLRGLRDFVTEQKARLGVVVNNDIVPRQYEEDLIGLPFTHF
ncbi:MAG: ATP-binding protein [Betaproteobacteria bacterium]|nr:ATP-binding protein [Betaproteobacteria bacterium]